MTAVYWFVYRVLPKTSGEITAPITRTGKVVRDSLGVPHISGETLEDALFLQGYVTAQDRLWQMDVLRRVAGGELSEVFGKGMLEADRESRKLRIRRIAENQSKSLSASDHANLGAFARGVNYFIETHLHTLPVEFTILAYAPRPWTIVDSMAIGLHMFRDLSTSWKDELQKQALRAGGDAQMVETLFPVRSGAEFQPGSNAWAIAGRLTATGKPILANDPHLEFAIPATWYMVHIQSPQVHVTGAALPGLPGVIIGHNERIAWGVTNLHFDVQDLYIEKLNAQNGQYVFRGKLEQARNERELIAVKGEKPVEFVNSITRHGPIWTAIGQQYAALKWIAAEPASFAYVFPQINAANNWEEFQAALERFTGPTQNFVYADVDGNIGYHAAGQMPIRRNYNGDVPVDGSSGEFEWDGTIPFEELPSAYNPASGVIITANQNPFPADYKYRVNGSFAPPYRARQIQALLSARKDWRPEDMLVVQKDVYSSFSHFLAQQVIAAYDKRGAKNPALSDAAEVLRAWKGQMEKGEPAPFLVTLIYQHIRRAVGDRAAPGKGTLYEGVMAGPVVEKLLRQRPAGWFPDYDQLLLRSFVDAVEEGRRLQGKNVNKWDYGQYIELNLRHPIGSLIPVVGPYFNVTELPMSGSSTTVKQTTKRIGPSMRMVVSTADWENSLQNITLGESGQFLSWHYRDQWNAYYSGRSFPMHFLNVDGSVLTVLPQK
ncbi:MAG TPA: penicillin acylase family protein [Bryobacteraceae bacterium]|nr:penicillin acylase family protein [Bryobacteraceae bacterium]